MKVSHVFCPVLVAAALSACERKPSLASEAVDSRIEATLRVQNPFSDQAIKEEVRPEDALAQAEAQWARVMTNFRAMLKKEGLEARPDIIASKQQVFEGWKRRFGVLVDLLKRHGGTLHRYDEGPEGSTGFIILDGHRQVYWLHFRFNRERDDY